MDTVPPHPTASIDIPRESSPIVCSSCMQLLYAAEMRWRRPQTKGTWHWGEVFVH